MAAAVTVGEVRSLIERFADALETNKADKIAVRGLRDLSAMFAGCEEKPFAGILKIAQRATPAASAQAKPSVASLMPAVASLRAVSDQFARKD